MLTGWPVAAKGPVPFRAAGAAAGMGLGVVGVAAGERHWPAGRGAAAAQLGG
jgi:hypothetical protein